MRLKHCGLAVPRRNVQYCGSAALYPQPTMAETFAFSQLCTSRPLRTMSFLRWSAAPLQPRLQLAPNEDATACVSAGMDGDTCAREHGWRFALLTSQRDSVQEGRPKQGARGQSGTGEWSPHLTRRSKSKAEGGDLPLSVGERPRGQAQHPVERGGCSTGARRVEGSFGCGVAALP